MAAQCWGCALGITGVPQYPPGDPLGACWECGVFGCRHHSHQDPVSGKWLCWPSVAKAISAGAGLDNIDEDLVIDSSAALEHRFPDLAQATRETRASFRTEAGRRTLRQAVEALGAEPDVDLDLLADALGVGAYLLPEERRVGGAQQFVLPGRVGMLLELALEASDG